MVSTSILFTILVIVAPSCHSESIFDINTQHGADNSSDADIPSGNPSIISSSNSSDDHSDDHSDDPSDDPSGNQLKIINNFDTPSDDSLRIPNFTHDSYVSSNVSSSDAQNGAGTDKSSDKHDSEYYGYSLIEQTNNVKPTPTPTPTPIQNNTTSGIAIITTII